MTNSLENVGLPSSDDSKHPSVKQQGTKGKWQGRDYQLKQNKGNLDGIMAKIPDATAPGQTIAGLNIDQKLPQETYDATKKKAKQAALHIQATEGSFPNGYERLIEIKMALKNMSDKELKKIYKPQLTSLSKLQETAQKLITSAEIWAEGRDSINRGFLVSADYSPYLKNPDVILAIFAMEAYVERKHKKPSDSPLFVCMSNKQPLMISGMIEYGLKDNSLIALECLPLNAKKTGFDPLQDYLNRKEIGKTFVPVMKAFDEAHKKLGLTGNSTISEPSPYKIDKWKTDYIELFHGIDRVIADYANQGKIKELLANFGGWGSGSLIKQAQNGLVDLCKEMGIKCVTHDFDISFQHEIDISLEDLAKRLACTVDILQPSISHNLDRLHLLASLINKKDEEVDSIVLKDGKTSLKEIFEAVFREFATPSEDKAIPAEQFYIRLKMIAEKEPFKSKIPKLPATHSKGFKPIPPPKPQKLPSPSSIKIEQGTSQLSPTSQAREIFGEVSRNFRVVKSPSGNFQIMWKFDSKESMQAAVSALRERGLAIKEGWQQKGFELTLSANETFQLLGNKLLQESDDVFNKIMSALE